MRTLTSTSPNGLLPQRRGHRAVTGDHEARRGWRAARGLNMGASSPSSHSQSCAGELYQLVDHVDDLILSSLIGSSAPIRGCDHRHPLRYCEPMKNITVTVDDETYRKARIKAAERDTSVSALVKRFLTDLAGSESDTDRLKRDVRYGSASAAFALPTD